MLQYRNTAVLIAAAASLAFVFGFAYGNLFDREYSFHLENWQTLVSAAVALVALTVAYIGALGTQRINVFIKEQDRIDDILPGLHQTKGVLDFC